MNVLFVYLDELNVLLFVYLKGQCIIAFYIAMNLFFLLFGIRMNSMMTEFWMNLIFYCPCMGVNLDLSFPISLSL